MPTRRPRHVRTAPEPLPITVRIDPERTMTPQQQAAWDWFVQEVHRRLGRDQQHAKPPPQEEETP